MPSLSNPTGEFSVLPDSEDSDFFVEEFWGYEPFPDKEPLLGRIQHFFEHLPELFHHCFR